MAKFYGIAADVGLGRVMPEHPTLPPEPPPTGPFVTEFVIALGDELRFTLPGVEAVPHLGLVEAIIRGAARLVVSQIDYAHAVGHFGEAHEVAQRRGRALRDRRRWFLELCARWPRPLDDPESGGVSITGVSRPRDPCAAPHTLPAPGTGS